MIVMIFVTQNNFLKRSRNFRPKRILPVSIWIDSVLLCFGFWSSLRCGLCDGIGICPVRYMDRLICPVSYSDQLWSLLFSLCWFCEGKHLFCQLYGSTVIFFVLSVVNSAKVKQGLWHSFNISFILFAVSSVETSTRSLRCRFSEAQMLVLIYC